MKYILFFIFLLPSISYSAPEHRQLTMYKACKHNGKAVDKDSEIITAGIGVTYCVSYIKAAAEATIYFSKYNREKLFCIDSDELNTKAVAKNVVSYLESLPKGEARTDFSIVLNALQSTYPCRDKDEIHSDSLGRKFARCSGLFHSLALSPGSFYIDKATLSEYRSIFESRAILLTSQKVINEATTALAKEIENLLNDDKKLAEFVQKEFAVCFVHTRG